MDELNHRKLAFPELRATTAPAIEGKWKSLSTTWLDRCDPVPRHPEAVNKNSLALELQRWVIVNAE